MIGQSVSSSADATLVTLLGAGEGMGTTTLCYNLAYQMTISGQRVVTLDLNRENQGLGDLAGIAPQAMVSDLISGRTDLHECLTTGWAGSLLLPTAPEINSASGAFPGWTERLISRIKELGKHAEYVLIDAGCQYDSLTQALWKESQHAALVLTPDAEAITTGYETLRSLETKVSRDKLWAIVNRTTSITPHYAMIQGLDRTCRKFLDLQVELLGFVDYSAEVTASNQACQPLAQRYPSTGAAVSMAKLTESLITAVSVPSVVINQKIA
ncbi:MAG: hypothetical protein WDZ51_05850 [Pirellulaceae bacterium]